MPRKNTKKKIKKKISKVQKFRQEFKNSLNTALVAAFGFLIALTWRDLILEFVEKISASSPIKGKLISALIVTAIGVLGIILVSHLFSKEE